MIKRNLDKKKLVKVAGTLLSVWVLFSLLFFMYRHFDVQEHNTLRAAIEEAPMQTSALIKEVNDRKGAHYAVFEFVVGQKRVEGRTFRGYKGVVGDRICVVYLQTQPSKNIYCNDRDTEPYHDAVAMASIRFSAIAAAFLVLIVAALVLWGIATGNKRLISKLTS